MTEDRTHAVPLGAIEAEAGIADRIAAVKAELDAVPKTGYNTFHQYHYHSESDIANAIRPLTAKHGLAIIPTVVEFNQEDFTTRKNEASRRTIVTLEIAILGGGEERVVRWYGEANDEGDKGLSKAYTAAMKSFQSKLFEIGAEESEGGRGSGRPTRGEGGPGGAPPDPDRPVTENQKGFITRLLAERAVPDERLREIAKEIAGGQVQRFAQATKLIDELKGYPIEKRPPDEAPAEDEDDGLDEVFGPPEPEQGPPV